jgi:hypothetical protein
MTMLKIKWAAIGLNVVLLLTTIVVFFADERGLGQREIFHYVLIALFALTPATSIAALWSGARVQSRIA